mgnify:CR=1 FL=1|tara:strand:- start:227 stop:610 length:384 start_codon:yes stop_codon:yes gene_type:complete
MADKIKLVQGDTKPALIVSLTDETTALPIGISGATVKLKFRASGGTSTLATVTGSLLTGKVNTDGTIDTTSPYDVAGNGGRVQFQWGSSDLNQSAGDYEGEIEITFSDGSIQTVYDKVKFKLREDFS